jgi:D-3-phosphoglycerate dehydrogenase
VVIIREDLLNIAPMPMTPIIMQNKLQADNQSMYNTPSTYNVYIAGLVFQWILDLGGLKAVEEMNARKAAKLYKYIDESKFYSNPVSPENRSRMNVPFLGRMEKQETEFLAGAKKIGLVFLAGHRSVGGYRASIYNAMPEAGIDKLIQYMKEFAAAHPAGKRCIMAVAEKAFAKDAIEKMDKVAAAAGYDLLTFQGYKNVNDLYKVLGEPEGLIVRSDKVDPKFLEHAKKTKIIVRAGAGYDTIDIEACKKGAVVVENTPGQNSNAVAELAIGYLIQCARNGFNGKSGCELTGRKLGLHGFGNTAKWVARLAKGFHMEIFAYDPFVSAEAMAAEGVKHVAEFSELYKTCDFVSIHTPLNTETRGCVTLANLMLLKKGGIVVNTARAEIIDDAVLKEMLAKRPDFKFGTDVISSVAFGKELQAAFPDRVFFSTVKSGAQTEEANTNSGTAAVKQIIDFFEKNDTTFQVNK